MNTETLKSEQIDNTAVPLGRLARTGAGSTVTRLVNRKETVPVAAFQSSI